MKTITLNEVQIDIIRSALVAARNDEHTMHTVCGYIDGYVDVTDNNDIQGISCVMDEILIALD